MTKSASFVLVALSLIAPAGVTAQPRLRGADVGKWHQCQERSGVSQTGAERWCVRFHG